MSRAHNIWSRMALIDQMTEMELRGYIRDSIPFLLDQRQELDNKLVAYRDELERLAAAEPAHRARIRALLNGDTT